MFIRTFTFATTCTVLLVATNTMMAKSAIDTDTQNSNIYIRNNNVEFSNRVDYIKNNGKDMRQSNQSYNYANGFTIAQAIQTSSISIPSSDLGQPNILKISAEAANARLNGEILIDGKTVKTLQNNSTTVNLSPLLSKGRHIVEVLGNYNPTNSAVSVEFSGSSSQISQQMSGNGQFRQKLIIDVQ